MNLSQERKHLCRY